ncbi:Next to BRCA1 gene 1 protein [Talaromyces islandicus]|uniref:Next to BRCA1 gene 1 protein n=1 Tax=Talaromyces islandicus TaxID=28573 RepID=A0A0U1LKM7_TALIS|nr:Next to BRCA1 gene 1 protein [Talaromyces islandicus]
MATPTTPAPPAGPDTLVTIKILQNASLNRRVKIPLRDLGARVFPQKIRQVLAIPPHYTLALERYSDSAACYVQLDSENPAVYKQLYRAAKAKLKLRIKVTSAPATTAATASEAPAASTVPELPSPKDLAQRYSYLDTVLSAPLSTNTMPQDVEAPSPIQAISPARSHISSLPLSPSIPQKSEYALRFSQDDTANGSFCIDCNHCGKVISTNHYHCSICDDGDYDLCLACVNAGVTCHGDDHWLLQRLVQNGVVNNSTTETITPKRAQQSPSSIKPTNPEKPPVIEAMANALGLNVDDMRTCDACFRDFPEAKMVTCNTCDDYDLCFACLLKNTHSHGHSFSAIQDGEFQPKNLPSPVRHRALCDGCDKRIMGDRHKCLACPDFDYCSSCIKAAHQTHPGHTFVPVYTPLPVSIQSHERHHNIYCDGPLCRNKPTATCIVGVRYKCAICHDTDFCQSCEALPTNPHNRTHPLIKFQTGVRNVSVSTLGDDGFGGHQVVMGDRTAPVVSPSAVVNQTSATQTNDEPNEPEVKEEAKEEAKEEVKAEVELEAQPEAAPVEEPSPTTESNEEHGAYFLRDTVPDGTSMPPSHVFEQTWTLYNPGPLSWPVGTSVGYVGGDVMFNIDSTHPSSTEVLRSAMSSNELTHPVGPSESANFTVTLKSPQQTGTAISYWRLKLQDGTPFGHKLWCDIKVAEPVVEEPVEAESLTESNMIFPKLEKESPVSSTHEAISTAAPPAPPLSTSDEKDILEDVESLTLEDADTEDDRGFLTDEEYDILDASDQECLNGKHA